MNQDDFGEGFFPQYIDRARLIGVFEMDEFAIVFGLIFLIVAASLAFPSLGTVIVMPTAFFVGMLGGISFKKFKKNKPDGFTVQWLYKTGLLHPDEDPTRLVRHPYLAKLRTVPYGFVKELVN